MSQLNQSTYLLFLFTLSPENCKFFVNDSIIEKFMIEKRLKKLLQYINENELAWYRELGHSSKMITI
jgi:hypothetical protein